MRRWVILAIFLPPILQASADEPPAPGRPWPGGERAALEIPDDLWAEVLAGTTGPGRPLGYTSDEMRNYGGREHLLRTVENLFRDARRIPRDTGRITDDLLKLAGQGKIEEVLQRCWGLLDLPAGRNFAAVDAGTWGVSWIPQEAPAAEAYAGLPRVPGWAWPLPEGAAERFAALPAAVQRLVLRLTLGAVEAHRWYQDTKPLEVQMPGTGGEPIPWLLEQAEALHASWVGPWEDEEYDQSATRFHATFASLRAFDAARHAYAAVLFGAHLRVGLEEWKAAGAAPADLPEGRWEIPTPLGRIVVSGRGDDAHGDADLEGGTWCVVDLGGNDRWSGGYAVSTLGGCSVALDLGGDDVWDAEQRSFALGCGAGGIGALVDLGGDDRYVVKESGLGCAWFGTGLLWDGGGNDQYVVKTRWGQGAAHAGVGILVDVAGNDRYECAEQSQGLGSTLGAGLLLDLEGNDAYECRDDGNVSALYLNQSVAMAQGCGYGRRADLGDGRSLAGGWGLLVDGAGNDRYHAQCWAQGCGYWWGVGVLEDRGGDDVYENGKYSAGAAAHFAIGVCVDLAGDDRWNQGVTTAKNQFQGHARDGSIGISIDGDGNDRYLLKEMCAGSADLGSMALFWDRRGDDAYVLERSPDASPENPGPFGTSKAYPPHRSFRDDLPGVGVFLDTGGKDAYEGDPRGAEGARDGGVARERRGPAAFGWFRDGDDYPSAAPR